MINRKKILTGTLSQQILFFWFFFENFAIWGPSKEFPWREKIRSSWMGHVISKHCVCHSVHWESPHRGSSEGHHHHLPAKSVSEQTHKPQICFVFVLGAHRVQIHFSGLKTRFFLAFKSSTVVHYISPTWLKIITAHGLLFSSCRLILLFSFITYSLAKIPITTCYGKIHFQ